MKYSLVELESFSGKKTSVYSLLDKEEQITLFETFLKENKSSHRKEINDIIKRLTVIGNKTGAREQFFKINEGNLGDGIVALYDNPNKKLRLYCIRYGSALIVLGGGGEKPKSIKAFQENEKLTSENYLLREIGKVITQKMKHKEIKICHDEYGDYFDGNLDIDIKSN